MSFGGILSMHLFIPVPGASLPMDCQAESAWLSPLGCPAGEPGGPRLVLCLLPRDHEATCCPRKGPWRDGRRQGPRRGGHGGPDPPLSLNRRLLPPVPLLLHLLLCQSLLPLPPPPILPGCPPSVKVSRGRRACGCGHRAWEREGARPDSGSLLCSPEHAKWQ